MTVSKDLLLAILSMDAYNQGYGRGTKHNKNQIGSATVDIQDISPEAQAAGFYAISYDVDASSVDGLDKDTTVISFRGTVNSNPGLGQLQ